jgi:hypothetical protein
MVNMAETESMFLGPNRLPLNGVVSDDSEPELEPPMLLNSYQQSTQRRNKRKNFQPRNIYYSEEEEAGPLALCKSNREEEALDLSSSEPESKRLRQEGEEEEEEEEEDEEEEEEEEEEPEEEEEERRMVGGGGEPGPAPIDLSSKGGLVGVGLPTEPPRGLHLLHQAFLGQVLPDATDMREYAQNTVKELLEIYGLNSAEVAESITNNVPIANFASGNYLYNMYYYIRRLSYSS